MGLTSALVIKFNGRFFDFLFLQHCFIYLPSDSTVTEDAGIEPRTVATLALTARCTNHLARSHPQPPPPPLLPSPPPPPLPTPQ